MPGAAGAAQLVVEPDRRAAIAVAVRSGRARRCRRDRGQGPRDRAGRRATSWSRSTTPWWPARSCRTGEAAAWPSVADAVGGVVHGPDVEVDGATIDSRTLRGGELFVPVSAATATATTSSAPRANAGARAYLTERAPLPDSAATAIAVAGTEPALLRLGAFGRGRRARTGWWGSPGRRARPRPRTCLAGVLATTYRTAASERSFNNELGVPLTLLNAPDDTEALVVEMGARGAGHVAACASWPGPTVGVVTNVVRGPHGDVRVRRRRGRAPRASWWRRCPRRASPCSTPTTTRRGHGEARHGRRCSRSGRRARDVRATRRAASTTSCAPPFRSRRRGATRRAAGGARRPPGGRTRLAAAAAALALGVSLDDVVRGPGARPSVSRVAHGAGGARRSGARHPQRRLQRQPGVHRGRPAGAGCRSRPTGASPCWAHARAGRRVRRRAPPHRRWPWSSASTVSSRSAPPTTAGDARRRRRRRPPGARAARPRVTRCS